MAGLLIVGLSVYMLSTGNFTRDTRIIETPSERMRDPAGIEDPDEADSPIEEEGEREETADSDYTCPEGWVNCMPGIRKMPEICNDKEYQQWAEKNCPNFKGIAH